MAARDGYWKRSLVWCGVTILAGLVAQHMWLDWRTQGSTLGLVLFVAVAAGLFGALAWSLWKGGRATVTFLVSIPFTVVVISATTLATIAGTLVLQRISPVRFDEFYGGAATLLRYLFFDDLFHSFWFDALTGLIALSLTLIALRRWPWTWKQIGYAASHLGIVIGLGGALIGQIGGQKGRIDIEVGELSSRMLGSDWRTGRRIPIDLPFAPRLDAFRIQEYAPVFRLYVFEQVGAGHEDDDFRPLLSVDPEKQVGEVVSLHAPYALRVDAYRPEGQATPAGGKPSHLLRIGERAFPIEPGRRYDDLGGYFVEVGAFFPHFTYDINAKQAANLSDAPQNPAVQVTLRKGGAQGEVAYQGWLFANMPGFSMEGHGKEGGFVPVYVFGGAGGGAGGPELVVTVLQGGREVSKQTLGLDQGRSFLRIAGGRYVGVFRVREKEAKNYYSTLSVLEVGQVVRTERIYVNEPMHYEGYAFYQANYDPRNLRYSGIEVVKDPGLPLVYLGLTLMMLGVFQIFYLRTLGARKEARS